LAVYTRLRSLDASSFGAASPLRWTHRASARQARFAGRIELRRGKPLRSLDASSFGAASPFARWTHRASAR